MVLEKGDLGLISMLLFYCLPLWIQMVQSIVLEEWKGFIWL